MIRAAMLLAALALAGAARAAESWENLPKFLTPFTVDGINDAIDFGLDVAEVAIVDRNGRTVYRNLCPECARVIWGGTDPEGGMVPAGIYICRIKDRRGGIHYHSLAVVK